MGSSDTNTVAWLRRCKPRATANSQPIAGLRPWKAPNPARMSAGQASIMSGRCPPRSPAVRGIARGSTCRSRIAVGIRRAIAALEAYLMGTVRCRPAHEKPLVEGDAALGLGVELHHPTLDAIGVELRID